MEESTSQFDFLKMYIEKTLDDAGFDAISEETRAQYVPQFVAEAEKRIGMALMPHLDEPAAADLEKLLATDASVAQVQQFWQTHVSDFNAVVTKTVEDFVAELKDTLKQLA